MAGARRRPENLSGHLGQLEVRIFGARECMKRP